MLLGRTMTVGIDDSSPGLPSVRLSPKLMKIVLVNRGTGVTTTEKLQDALCWRESVTSHETDVVPFWKSLPDAGEQATVSGGEPLSVCGRSNETAASGCPLWESAARSAGQLITGSSKTTGAGCTTE